MPDKFEDDNETSQELGREPESTPEERASIPSTPDAVQLDEIQDSIEELVESGDAEQALSELQELRVPDKAEVLADLEPENRQTLLGNLSNDEIADVWSIWRSMRRLQCRV